jgi:hypothetical protein
MAIVADLSGNFPVSLPNGIDRKHYDYSRILNGSPVALSTVPEFAGEIVLNSVNGELWYAKSVTAAGWTPFRVAY